MERDYPNNNNNQDNGGDDGLNKPLSASSRRGFIRKVYGILSGQLGLSAVWCLLVMRSTGLQALVSNTSISIIMAIITIASVLILGLSRRVARRVPLNYVLLGLVTMGTAWSTSHTISYFDPSTVVQALGATAASVSGLSIYAMSSTRDINYLMAFLVSGLVSLIVQLFGFLLFTPNAYHMGVNMTIAASSSLSILYQTDAILGRKSLRYSTDDYIQAAMNMYIEIVQLFIRILQILDSLKGKDEDKSEKKKKNRD